MLFDFRHAVRDCYACQTDAAFKCGIANGRYTAISRDDTGCTSQNQLFCSDLYQAVSSRAVSSITILNRNARQV